MKIVIRAPNWIGDSIFAIPAIVSLCKNFPETQVWIAAREWVKDLFTSFNFIENIIPLPDQSNLKSLKVSVQRLKEYDFDVGVLLSNSFSSALLLYLAKIPQRWGYKKDGRGVLLTNGVSLNNQRNLFHQVHYYLNLISGLGLQTFSPQLSFPVTQEERQQAKNLLASLNVNLEKRIIILNPGAFYGSSKRWPVLKYAELSKLYQDKYKANILIIGSPNEAGLAESIASHSVIKPFILTGKTNLRQLAALTSQADLFITNDSGPMHLANALKIPVVALFGPTDPRITGPFQEPSAIIKKDVPCWPCSYRECPFDHRCMMNIEPKEVFQVSQKFLK